MREALDIQVKGIVQGVGFRPFVYRLARRYLIDGWVLNAVESSLPQIELPAEYSCLAKNRANDKAR